MKLAFEHLNLRRNPFGGLELNQLAQFAVLDIQAELDFLNQPGRCVIQFMGDSGRGKSTHMHAIHAHFSSAPFLYFAPDHQPKIPKKAPVVFLDETQRLSWFKRAITWRRHQKLIVGTHQDHQVEFKRAGLRCRVIHLSGLDAKRLRHILMCRINGAVRDKQKPSITPSTMLLDGLIAMYGDDLRAILSLLYELVQSMTAPGDIPWPPDDTIRKVEPSRHLRPGEVREIVTSAMNKGKPDRQS